MFKSWADSDSNHHIPLLPASSTPAPRLPCLFFLARPVSRILDPSDLALRSASRASSSPPGHTTVLPSSLLPRRCAAADLHSCSSCLRVNPSLMANSAAAKRPKRPGSIRDVQPPVPKRVRGASSRDELHVAVAANIKGNKLPCPSSGKDPKIPTCFHPSVTKNQIAESPESVTQSKPPISMRQLIENARLAMDWAHPAAEEEASRRRDIERSREEARRKVERMVDTVQFNDPYIDPSDVTKSPEELLQARQEAWRAQAQLIAMARRREGTLR